MNDYIVRLNNIRVKALHGLHPAEKVKPQLFEFDIAVSYFGENCDDKIKKTIDYEHIYNLSIDVFKNNSFNLLETLGEEIINLICVEYNVKNVSITIRKPEIFFDSNSNCVEVSIIRNNE